MKRWLLAFSATILVACGSASEGPPVALLTGVDANACYAGGEGRFEGLLVAGGDHGTMLDGKPVMWPVGWTGRRVGTEIEILNGSGKVVATTGRRYNFGFGPISNLDDQATQARLVAAPVGACSSDFVPSS